MYIKYSDNLYMAIVSSVYTHADLVGSFSFTMSWQQGKRKFFKFMF